MKMTLHIIATIMVIIVAIQLSPFRKPSGSHDSGAFLQTNSGGGAVSLQPLRSVLAIQKDVNATLRSYGKPPIQEDGVWGPRTASAYLEAYSLQQAGEVDRGHYER